MTAALQNLTAFGSLHSETTFGEAMAAESDNWPDSLLDVDTDTYYRENYFPAPAPALRAGDTCPGCGLGVLGRDATDPEWLTCSRAGYSLGFCLFECRSEAN